MSVGLKRMKLLAGICLLVGAMLSGCTKAPTANDVVGTWANPDGATLTLKGDGTFTAKGLSRRPFFPFDPPGPPYEGSGIWKLRKDGYWTLDLSFEIRSGGPVSIGIPVYVANSAEPPYLFTFVKEIDGPRYKLLRAPTQ